MGTPTIQLGNGNWAGKSDSLLGFHIQNGRFYKQEFTFNRTTTGTYTDSEGYIQEMPYNLLQQSNQFDTTWLNSGTTETSGQSGYDGTNNAWLLEKSQSNGYIYQNITQSNTQTISVYAKSGSVGGIQILIDDSVNSSQSYNLDNGTLIGTGNGESSSIENVGGGWYRCIFTINDSATRIRFYPATNTGDKTGTSGSIYIQNAQLVKGSSAKTYFPTTTRLNMPRVDYLNNSNGSLILEPQSTNLVTYSEDFRSNSNFTTNAPNSIFESGYLAPDGSLTATRINGFDGYYVALSNLGSGDARSMYVKSGNGQTGNVNILDPNSQTHSLFEVTNKWKRVELVGNDTWFYIVDGRGASLTLDDVIVWGLQQENLSYATSYIPTSGSSVTRNQDICSITNVADRINSTEGTIYVEMAALANDSTNRYISINNGTSSKRIIFKFGTSSNNISALGLGTASSFNMSYSGTTITNMNKIALKYKANDCALWVNGEEVATDSTFTAYAANTLNKITFSNFAETGQFLEANVKNFMLYNTALTDSELATLTT